jgi:hypothetical protein
VAGRLLVARGDGLDRVGPVVERVEQPHVAVAAEPEHVRDLLARQVLDDDLAAVHGILPRAPACRPARPSRRGTRRCRARRRASLTAARRASPRALTVRLAQPARL